MKKYLIFLIAILFLMISVVYSATNNMNFCEEDVSEINRMPLVKFYIRHRYPSEKFELEECTKKNDDAYIDTSCGDYYEFLYTDEDGNIRKHMFHAQTEDLGVKIISYYSENGSLCKITSSFSSTVSERYNAFDVEERGSLIFCKDKVVNGNFKLSYRLIDEEKFQTQTIYYDKYPKMIGDEDISMYMDTDTLKKILNIEAISSSKEKSLLFNFTGALEGKFTIVNTNNTKVRRLPDNDSEIQDEYDVGTVVKVIEKIDKDCQCWYKIVESVTGKEGYILGSFLEPVENIDNMFQGNNSAKCQ